MWEAHCAGHSRNIHFPFDIEGDTAMCVASEMVEELDLSNQDVTTIAEMIDAEILALVPEWRPGVAVDEGGVEADSAYPTVVDGSDEVGSGDSVVEDPPSSSWKGRAVSPRCVVMMVTWARLGCSCGGDRGGRLWRDSGGGVHDGVR